jgi:hypothetical protein
VANELLCVARIDEGLRAVVSKPRSTVDIDGSCTHLVWHGSTQFSNQGEAPRIDAALAAVVSVRSFALSGLGSRASSEEC